MLRWLKFNAVGAMGIVVQVVTLAVLTRISCLGYLPATAIAVESAVLHNFVWHEHFTWRDRKVGSIGLVSRRLLRFNITTGAVSIGGNLVFMRLFVGTLEWKPLIANVISIAACSVFNFLIADFLVFRNPTLAMTKTREINT